MLVVCACMCFRIGGCAKIAPGRPGNTQGRTCIVRTLLPQALAIYISGTWSILALRPARTPPGSAAESGSSVPNAIRTRCWQIQGPIVPCARPYVRPLSVCSTQTQVAQGGLAPAPERLSSLNPFARRGQTLPGPPVCATPNHLG